MFVHIMKVSGVQNMAKKKKELRHFFPKYIKYIILVLKDKITINIFLIIFYYFIYLFFGWTILLKAS